MRKGKGKKKNNNKKRMPPQKQTKRLAMGDSPAPYRKEGVAAEVVPGSIKQEFTIQIKNGGIYFPKKPAPRTGVFTMFVDTRNRKFKGFLSGIDLSGCYFAYTIKLMATKMRDLRGAFYQINEVITVEPLPLTTELLLQLWAYYFPRYSIRSGNAQDAFVDCCNDIAQMGMTKLLYTPMDYSKSLAELWEANPESEEDITLSDTENVLTKPINLEVLRLQGDFEDMIKTLDYFYASNKLEHIFVKLLGKGYRQMFSTAIFKSISRQVQSNPISMFFRSSCNPLFPVFDISLLPDIKRMMPDKITKSHELWVREYAKFRDQLCASKFQGSTCLPLEELLISKDILDQMILYGIFKQVNYDGRQFLYDAYDYQIETRLGIHLKRIIALEHVGCAHDELMDEVSFRAGFDDEQSAALKSAVNRSMTIIQGVPGAGKSTVMARAINFKVVMQHQIVLVSTSANDVLQNFTGIVQGCTEDIIELSKMDKKQRTVFYGLQTSLDKAGTDIEKIRNVVRKAKAYGVGMYIPWNIQAVSFRAMKDSAHSAIFEFVDSVFVEEPSMVSNEQMCHLLDAIPCCTSFIAFGDQEQIAPIEPGIPFTHLVTYTKNHATQPSVKYCQLMTAYRAHADSPLLRDNLKSILDLNTITRCIGVGTKVSDIERQWINIHCKKDGPMYLANLYEAYATLHHEDLSDALMNTIVVTYFKEDVAELNRAIRRKLFGVKYDFKELSANGALFVKGEKLRVERQIRTSTAVKFTGSVFIVGNIKQAKRYVDNNNQQQTIHNIRDLRVAITNEYHVVYEDVDYVSMKTWNMCEIQIGPDQFIKLSEVNSDDFTYGYAGTVHSGQGKGADFAILYITQKPNLQRIKMTRNFINVALSRAKLKQAIVGDLEFFEMAIANWFQPTVYSHLDRTLLQEND